MPVCVFTFHTYLSWLPNHPRGYVRRRRGVLASNEKLGEIYASGANYEAVVLSENLQQFLIEEAQRACSFQKLRLHLVATAPTHIHVLVSWKGAKPWQRVRDGLKTSFTRSLRKLMRDQSGDAERPFFSDGASRKHIRTRTHFDHWMNTYGPSHDGWKWREGTGLFK